MAYPGGVSGYTLKNSTSGCSCHTSSTSSSVSLTINGPATLTTGQQASYSVVMTYTSNITAGGMDIAASTGTLINSDARLKVLNGELTQPSAQTGTTTLTWNFKYTAPATAGNQILYATGCAVKSKWNRAPNFTINVIPAVTSSISLLAPTTNESLQAGDSKNITWTSTGVTNVKLEYSTDNGTIWSTIIASTPAAAGSYTWIVPNTPSTQCKVRISDVSNAAISNLSGVFIINSIQSSDEISFNKMRYSLDQNYPNPFNPSTVIRYSIPYNSTVSLNVYNTEGANICKLFKGNQEAGYHEMNFIASSLPSGVYFYRIEAKSNDGKNNFSFSRKMILLK
jgi:hypothetical protein